ncbi:hypothetical protein HPP92_015446 [Vanilla planifolia]|uniref:TFIIH p62 subunit N-terminal domain-containing protein n=1 Tax=Vanilla planifolia TaxID=51239 RepID=A0A835QLV4_VANPL|nr:hypothetical protein HPP92_015446 [Vanilla planifolia]
MASINIAAKYKISLKEPGIAGVLRMAEERFTFTPHDPRSDSKLDVPFRSVKAHKFSKDGSKQALLNIQLHEDDLVGNLEKYLGRVLAKLQSVAPAKVDKAVPNKTAPSVSG